MDVDNYGNVLTKVLEGMTLKVKQLPGMLLFKTIPPASKLS
jgi:hypothetical protein